MTAPFGHYTAMTKLASEVGGPMPLAMLLIGGGMAVGVLADRVFPRMKHVFAGKRSRASGTDGETVGTASGETVMNVVSADLDGGKSSE